MKTKILLPLLLVAAFLSLQACWLMPSRIAADALFKPARLAWPAVNVDFQRGLADGEADGDLETQAADILRALAQDFGTALTSEDLVAVREIPWSTMAPWASRGIADKIDDGEIGPGVAASLTEQLSNFSETIQRLKTK